MITSQAICKSLLGELREKEKGTRVYYQATFAVDKVETEIDNCASISEQESVYNKAFIMHSEIISEINDQAAASVKQVIDTNQIRNFQKCVLAQKTPVTCDDNYDHLSL